MKQYLVTSIIDDKISYKKKITSNRITYEYYSTNVESKTVKQYSIPYAKQIAVGMLFLMLFLVN